jgi:DNA-binding NarL/FixJ family response regulator
MERDALLISIFQSLVGGFVMGIRIVIADDQALIRDGLKTVLDLEEDMEVIGTAVNGVEAFDAIKNLEPDILLLDIRMPIMGGVECVREIKRICTPTKVIMLTTFNDEEYIMSAIAAGACGYLLKDIEVAELIEAIHDALAGKMVMPLQVVSKLAEGLAKVVNVKNEHILVGQFGFSDREKEIAKIMAQGFNNKQMSTILYISEGTLRNYISSIYSKIGISDRTQAVLYLREYFV